MSQITLYLTQLQTLAKLCTEVMRCDQYPSRRQIRTLQTKVKSGQPIAVETIQQLVVTVEQSLQRRQHRAAQLPIPQFSEELPVSQRRAEIAAAIAQHQVIILSGETGSGKTTQLPKICLTLGRGVAGLIGCTQPRRIAARTVADRVASELQSPLGHAVGYKVRFSDRTSPHTYIKFMTDGILLAETQGDRFLEMYDTLIIDEAHERSLNIDFLLGYLRQLLPKRPDLKVIITSATIDTERFANHFNHAPIIHVSGRMYPVETRYRPLLGDAEEEDRNIIQGILDAVDEITSANPLADILVFLSGERDIREATEALRKHRLFHTEVLPLYARLSAAEQNRVFAPRSERRIILATNVAETSLTVPRIKAVIDTGLARISRYSIRTKVQRLPIEKISRSSADQRKGRCGRVAPGICIRLYDEADYFNRPEFTDPEILRSSLASVILQMLYLRLGDIEVFPFIDPPLPKMINDGITLLTELEAVDDKRRLTDIGRQLAQLPIDPRIGRMILAAQQENCLTEMLVIASALSIQDPRERPLDAQEAADNAQRRFNDERSDFLSFLKLWAFFQEQTKHLSKNKLRNLCHELFLSYLRMQEWHDIHQQLYTLVREANWSLNETEASYEAIHRALLAGLLGNVAYKSNEDYYLGTRTIKLFLFPGSGLFKKPPKWLMAAELVETTRLYARCVARIEPEWIEHIAGDLCQRSYFEPHWEKKTAQVAAYEKVTLYGLTIVPQRKVNYGPKDPKLARELFIRHALVEGEYHCTANFFKYNQTLLADIATLEHKARRQDILVDEEQIFAFYAQHIPEGIYNGMAFEKWLKHAERQDPHILFLSREVVMKPTGEAITPYLFPDYLAHEGAKLLLHYHFAPGDEQDGVTVTVPLALLNQLAIEPFAWLVPGLLEEKIVALLRGLPKTLRKFFVPVPDVAHELVEAIKKPVVTFREGGSFLEYPKQSLYEMLYFHAQRRLGKPLPPDCWQTDALSPHLLMNFRLLDLDETTLDGGRDLAILQQKWGDYASKTLQQKITEKSGLYQENVTTWNFGDLPPKITLQINEVALQGFPTLLDAGDHVVLQVLDNPTIAKIQLREGLRRLFWLALPTKKLLKQMPISHRLCLQYMKVGNCEQLKEDMLIALVESIFLVEPLPTRQADFDQRLISGKQQLFPVAYRYADYLAEVLTEYDVLTQRLNKFAEQAVAEIRQHLNHLIYDGFVREIPLEQLKQVPRYLKAIRLRLERLELDPHKDAKKATQIAPLWQAYLHRRAQQSTPAIELTQFRWMLEELRVSLFAQELKTPYPVSVERLQKAWEELLEGAV